MPRYIIQDGELVEVVPAPRRPSVFPMIARDIPEYVSPVTGRPVDGRAARREDLKRSGCREVDPSEWKSPGMYSPTMAARFGAEHVPPPPMPKHVMDWRNARGIQRAEVDAPPIMPFAKQG